jgi:hypothetical protein
MNHHHDARNGLGAAEMPHRVEHIPLFLDLHFGLVQAVKRTHERRLCGSTRARPSGTA